MLRVTHSVGDLAFEPRLAICRVHVLKHESGRLVSGILYGSVAQKESRALHWENQEPEAHLTWRQVRVCMCPEAWKGGYMLMYTFLFLYYFY